MPLTIDQLRTEITTDPTSLGYAAMSDYEVAVALNLPRQTITVREQSLNPQDVLEAIDVRDFVATSNAGAVAWFESVTQLRSIRLLLLDGTDTRVIANFRRLLGNTNGSTTRLNVLANRQGSRAEQLGGPGTAVNDQQVAEARRV